jgi:Holliday junction resolvase RusA-like endonuclease
MRLSVRDWKRLGGLSNHVPSRRPKGGETSASGREFAASPGVCFRAAIPLAIRPKARPRVFVSDRAFREGFARQGLRTANADEAFPIAWTAMRSLTPAATRETERVLRQALAVEMRRAGLVPVARPLAVSFDFVFEGDSCLAPVGKRDGDLDNLEKLALDAMNGVVFEDDRLVVMKWSRKRFGPEPLIAIRAVEITEATSDLSAECMLDAWLKS